MLQKLSTGNSRRYNPKTHPPNPSQNIKITHMALDRDFLTVDR